MTRIVNLGPHGRLLSDDYGRRTDRIKVDLATNTYVTVRLFTAFVEPGDSLLIVGEANLTNNTGRSLTGKVTGSRYSVGIGTSLWVYDANAPADVRAATWLRLGTDGENVTPEGHHISQGLIRDYRVPAAWDPTHQMGIALRVDAHSTGYDDNTVADYVLVESHGVLLALHWPQAVVDDPRWAGIAALEARVAALESATPSTR